MSLIENIRNMPGWSLLSPDGRRIVTQAFSCAPDRTVGTNALVNVCGGYASAKFPFLVEYESAGCEKPYILLSVLDEEVLALQSQPTSLVVTVHDKLGRRRPIRYTPDFLEVREDRFWLVEAKTESDLIKLSAKSADWTRDERGWHYTPAETAAETLGLGFKIFCPDTYPRAFLVNTQYFASVTNEDLLASSPSVLARTKKALRSRPLPLEVLCQQVPDITGGFVFQAIVAGRLFGNINSQHFDSNFLVYGSADSFERTAGHRSNTPCRDPGPLEARLLCASENEISAAMERAEKYDSRRDAKVEKNSNERRLASRIKAAELEGAPRLAAFVPNYKARGGSAPKVPEECAAQVVQCAKEYLLGGAPYIKTKIYAHYRLTALDSGEYVVSRETHRKLLSKNLAPERAAFYAGGKRAFHAAKPRTGGDDANSRLQIAGMRCHLDGVFADLKSKQTDEHPSLRLIIYPMLDDISGRVLGRGIRVGKGNRQTVLMAIRDSYLRCGCLPGTVYMDRGSEFNNATVEQALGFFGCSYEFRPSGAPRMGGMGEMFNAQLSRFLQGFEGGMYFDKAGRSADGSKKSARTATLSIEDIISQLDEWIFEVWNKTPIGRRQKAPDEVWASSLQMFPDVVQGVADSPLARYFTSVPLDVQIKNPVHGLRYGSQAYSAADLAQLIASGRTPTSPRLDCEDPSVVHVLTNDGPLELHSLDYQRCQGLSQGRLVLEMHNLSESRSRADTNQKSRNFKEAQQQRSFRTAQKSITPPVQPKTPKGSSASYANNVVDFSLKNPLPRLESVKSRIQGERK